MKKISTFVLTIVMGLLLMEACNAQPKTTYKINIGTPVPNAVKYHYFLQKKTVTPLLVQGMDYLNPDVSNLQIGTSALTSFDVTLDNDGSEYIIGAVAEDAAGFYGGMGTNTGVVGKVPGIPGLITFIKK